MRKQNLRKISIFLTVAFLLTACGTGLPETGSSLPETGSSLPETGSDTSSDPSLGESIQELGLTSAKTPMKSESGQNKDTDTPDSSEAQKIDGEVRSLGEGSFVISQFANESDGNGSETMIMNLEDETLVTVHYSDSTSFVIRTTTDGMTSTESAGSLADVTAGKNVTLEGQWDGSDFQADKVTVWDIQMEG